MLLYLVFDGEKKLTSKFWIKVIFELNCHLETTQNISLIIFTSLNHFWAVELVFFEKMPISPEEVIV